MCGDVYPDESVWGNEFICRPLHEPNCVNGKWDGVCDDKIQNWVAAGIAGVDGWSADAEEAFVKRVTQEAKDWSAGAKERAEERDKARYAKAKRAVQEAEEDAAQVERVEAQADAQFIAMVLIGCAFVMLLVWMMNSLMNPQQPDAGGKGKRQ